VKGVALLNENKSRDVVDKGVVILLIAVSE
jgi:hypothetical protein